MAKTLGFLLEYIRILAYLFIGLMILGFIEELLFQLLHTLFHIKNIDYRLSGIANLIFLFVFYRNTLQFSGWFKSVRNRPLPKGVTRVLLLLSLGLLILSVL
ncbi:MAG: hypothetical protein H0Z33_06700 [Bacillaceae bacterium]|nr:hypothetical protein [Bacillaceae bacterium]